LSLNLFRECDIRLLRNTVNFMKFSITAHFVPNKHYHVITK